MNGHSVRVAVHTTWNVPSLFVVTDPRPHLLGRLRLICDDTRAETRFRLSEKRTSPFKSTGASVQSTTGSWGVRIIGSSAGYTMFQGSVKSTGYTLHSPVSPSLPLPCVTVCHHISTGLYFCNTDWTNPSTLQSVRPYSEGRWKQGSSKESNKRYGSWLGLVILRATVLRSEAGVENSWENKFVWLLRISFVRRGTNTRTSTFCPRVSRFTNPSKWLFYHRTQYHNFVRFFLCAAVRPRCSESLQ
jgi:hypothetical protein